MKEAFRLLNKSIIRVEQPDVHLEEEEEDEAPMDLGAGQSCGTIYNCHEISPGLSACSSNYEIASVISFNTSSLHNSLGPSF